MLKDPRCPKPTPMENLLFPKATNFAHSGSVIGKFGECPAAISAEAVYVDFRLIPFLGLLPW